MPKNLTDDVVAALRDEHFNQHMKLSAIARKHNIPYTTARGAVLGLRKKDRRARGENVPREGRKPKVAPVALPKPRSREDWIMGLEIPIQFDGPAEAEWLGLGHPANRKLAEDIAGKACKPKALSGPAERDLAQQANEALAAHQNTVAQKPKTPTLAEQISTVHARIATFVADPDTTIHDLQQLVSTLQTLRHLEAM